MVAYSHNEIDELVIRAQSGDKAAIAVIYEQFVDRVYRFVASRIALEADAEDVTADVFMQMLSGDNAYIVGNGDFQRWLYDIAKTCIVKYEAATRRKHKVDTVFLSMMDQSDVPENQLLKQEQFANLREAMRNLSPDEYSVLILRFVEGKSHEEVASIMRKSTSATRIMQFRALKSLAKELQLEKKRHYMRNTHSSDDEE
jgi:RNA polymerase sigma-70 factor (ECF subfamily)